MCQLTKVFELFNQDFGLHINESKSIVFWIGNKQGGKLKWTNELKWT
jgi:hypothetical protein